MVDFGLSTTDRAQRQTAFDACRQALQASDSPSYAEQFQGLYAFMRGLFAASIVLIANYLGWLLGSRLGPSWWQFGQMSVVLIAATWLFTVLFTRHGFWVLIALAAAAGTLTGMVFQLSPATEFGIALLAVLLTVLAAVSRRAYEMFALKFATTVYEAYYVRCVARVAKPK